VKPPEGLHLSGAASRGGWRRKGAEGFWLEADWHGRVRTPYTQTGDLAVAVAGGLGENHRHDDDSADDE
jgi:hypothetical protein